MGYEIKLKIGNIYNFVEDDGSHTMAVQAEIDLCKIGSGPLSRLVSNSKNKSKNTKDFVNWFESDGNTKTNKDLYDERFNPVSLSNVIEALKKDNKKDPYNRFSWAIALLTSIEKTSPGEFKILFFGH